MWFERVFFLQNGDITTVSGLTYTQQNYTLDPAVNASTGQIYYTMLYCFSDYVESVRDALLPYGEFIQEMLL